MSRRRRAVKRKTLPDGKYGSVLIAKFINCIMLDGKKSLAEKIVYGALEEFKKRVRTEDLLFAFGQVMENAMPTLEVKSRRVGGATYQVPVEISENRRSSMAMRWIIMNARKKVGKNMMEGLTMELVDCFHQQGATIKKKEDTHRMAEANKAFAHYKW